MKSLMQRLFFTKCMTLKKEFDAQGKRKNQRPVKKLTKQFSCKILESHERKLVRNILAIVTATLDSSRKEAKCVL